MHILNVIGTVVSCLSLLLSIAIGVLGWYVYTKLTANDLAHLSKFALELKEEFLLFRRDCKACSDVNNKELRSLHERLSSIEGYLKGRNEPNSRS
jgi:hypothetical protein